MVLVLLLISPVSVLVGSNDDVQLTASTAVSHLVPLKSQFVMSSAPADEIETKFNELFSTFANLMAFSRDKSDASCVVTPTA